MDVTTTFIIVRALERLVIVLIGGASLWMGWQLFLRLQTESDQKAELAYKDLTFKLERVGPGVFFALFGAVILGIAIYKLPTLRGPESAPAAPIASAASPAPTAAAPVQAIPTVMMFNNASQGQLERMIVAVNLAMVVQSAATPPPIPARNWKDFKDGDLELVTIRNELLARRFGHTAVTAWLQARQGGSQVPPDAPKDVQHVDDLAAKLNYE